MSTVKEWSVKLHSSEDVELVSDFLLWGHICFDKETFGMNVKSKSPIDYTNSLLGNTLTIIEASIADPIQREAIVKLVKKMFNSKREAYKLVIYNMFWWDHNDIVK